MKDAAAHVPVSSRSEQPVIEVDLLLFFAAVAEELSFTRASRRLGIDQSWLSHKIRQLEVLVGMPLFVRDTRHVSLSPAGHRLLEPARRLTAVAAEARAAAEFIRDGIDGALRVGALPFSFSHKQSRDLLDMFMLQHSNARITIINGPSPDLIAQLRDGRIDIAFVSAPADLGGLETIQLHGSKHVVLIPSEDPLAALETIRPEDLAGRQVVMPHQRFNPATYETYYQPFVDGGAVPVNPPEFEAAAAYAKRWRMIAVCSDAAAQTFAADGFVARPVAGGMPSCAKYLVRRRDRSSGAAEAFWDLVQAQTAAARKSAGRPRRPSKGQARIEVAV